MDRKKYELIEFDSSGNPDSCIKGQIVMANNTGNGMIKYMFDKCFAKVYRVVMNDKDQGSVLFQVGDFTIEQEVKYQNAINADKFKKLKDLLS